MYVLYIWEIPKVKMLIGELLDSISWWQAWCSNSPTVRCEDSGRYAVSLNWGIDKPLLIREGLYRSMRCKGNSVRRVSGYTTFSAYVTFITNRGFIWTSSPGNWPFGGNGSCCNQVYACIKKHPSSSHVPSTRSSMAFNFGRWIECSSEAVKGSYAWTLAQNASP